MTFKKYSRIGQVYRMLDFYISCQKGNLATANMFANFGVTEQLNVIISDFFNVRKEIKIIHSFEMMILLTILTKIYSIGNISYRYEWLVL